MRDKTVLGLVGLFCAMRAYSETRIEREREYIRYVVVVYWTHAVFI